MAPPSTPATRIEHDSFGELRVPQTAFWGAQTQRAVQNFQFSSLRMPRGFLRALGLLKAVAADTNAELGHLPPRVARAIRKAALLVSSGEYDEHFPVDVFQTGSGTSTNMNANEVIAHVASEALGKPVHPNDHVNQGQSSNDVIPTALLVAVELALQQSLLPSLAGLREVVDGRAKELSKVVKTGRTHLMDAMPLTFGQELSGWSAALDAARERFVDCSQRLRRLPWGGTAVGTGINADPGFAPRAIARLSEETGLAFSSADNLFHGLSNPDSSVELAGHLNTLASTLFKISNDLRWMNSGPLSGLGEIALPALQPGSSIMPGKVNPVIPEAVAMIAAQVFGNTHTVTFAGASGNFQLNVMFPVIAHNLLESIELLSAACRGLAEKAIAGFVVQEDELQAALSRNPILVTALNPLIGYERAAALAKQAYKEKRAILEVAHEQTDLPLERLQNLLDPFALTRGGLGSEAGDHAKPRAARAQKKPPGAKAKAKAQRRR